MPEQYTQEPYYVELCQTFAQGISYLRNFPTRFFSIMTRLMLYHVYMHASLLSLKIQIHIQIWHKYNVLCIVKQWTFSIEPYKASHVQSPALNATYNIQSPALNATYKTAKLWGSALATSTLAHFQRLLDKIWIDLGSTGQIW